MWTTLEEEGRTLAVAEERTLEHSEEAEEEHHKSHTVDLGNVQD